MLAQLSQADDFHTLDNPFLAFQYVGAGVDAVVPGMDNVADGYTKDYYEEVEGWDYAS